MTKRQVDTVLESYLDLDGLTLTEAIKTLQAYAKEHGADSKLAVGKETESYSNYESVYQRVMGKREETDAEYAKRLEKEAQQKAWQDQQELETFKKLQAKFGVTK